MITKERMEEIEREMEILMEKIEELHMRHADELNPYLKRKEELENEIGKEWKDTPEISNFDAAVAQMKHYVKELGQLLEQKDITTVDDIYANNAEFLRALHSVHDTVKVVLDLSPHPNEEVMDDPS